MSKKYPSNKINVTKNAIFFLSQAPTDHSFTFNSQILYELKHNFHLSKKSVRFCTFHLVSRLLKFIFLFNKEH